jgi:large subunit ribosomal protein L17
MIKKVFGRKFSRSKPAREALFSGLMRNIILGDKIVTTKAKAKAIQGNLDKLVTMAKKNTLSSRRQILSNLDNAKDATSALFKKVEDLFADRKSGFTRIINLKARKGDNAQIVRLEWVKKDENITTKKD